MPVFRLCLGLGHTPLSGTVQVFGAPPRSPKTGAVQSHAIAGVPVMGKDLL